MDKNKRVVPEDKGELEIDTNTYTRTAHSSRLASTHLWLVAGRTGNFGEELRPLCLVEVSARDELYDCGGREGCRPGGGDTAEGMLSRLVPRLSSLGRGNFHGMLAGVVREDLLREDAVLVPLI